MSLWTRIFWSNVAGVVGLPLPSPNASPSPNTPKKKRFTIFPWNRHSAGHKAAKSKSRSKDDHDVIDMSNRPPCPLPSNTRPRADSQQEYDYVRSTNVNRLPELLQMLRMTSDQSSEKCECGLTLEESELPAGWSMHISHDEHTRGRLFFMGPRGETSWNMPLEVSLDLCADDQDRVRRVKAKCDDLQHRVQRSAAPAVSGANLAKLPGNSMVFQASQLSSNSSQRLSGFTGSGSGGMPYPGSSSGGMQYPYPTSNSGSGFSDISFNQAAYPNSQMFNANASQLQLNGFQLQQQQSLTAQIPTTVMGDFDSTLDNATRIPTTNVYPATSSGTYSNGSRSSSIPNTPAPSLPTMTLPPVPNNPQRHPAQHNYHTGSTTGVSPASTISLTVTNNSEGD